MEQTKSVFKKWLMSFMLVTLIITMVGGQVLAYVAPPTTVTDSTYLPDGSLLPTAPDDIVAPTAVAPNEPSITLTADDEFEVYHNGVRIGAGTNWKQAGTFPLKVTQGKNVIAVKAKDHGIYAGLLAEINAGPDDIFTTDFNWKSTSNFAEGWHLRDFNDTAWQRAKDFGSYGITPWDKYVVGMPADTAAKWIWPGDTNYSTPVKEAYFRFEFIINPDGSSGVANPITSVGSFSNVTHQLKSTTAVMPASVKNRLDIKENIFEDEAESGSFVLTQEEYRQITPSLAAGKIYFDGASNKAIKISQVLQDGTSFRVDYAAPALDELLEYYDIPEQTVEIAESNIVYPAEKMSLADHDLTVLSPTSTGCGKVGNDFTCNFNKVLVNQTGTNGKVYVEASGSITLQFPKVSAVYNRKKYDVKFTAGEKAKVTLKGEAKFHKEVKVPIFGFNIKAGSLASASVGVFLVIGVDGSVTFEFVVDQGYFVEAGIRGKNFFWIPISFKPYANTTRYLNITHNIEGQIKAWAGVKAEVSLKIAKLKVIAVSVFAGIEGQGKWTSNTNVSSHFSLTIDALVKGEATVLNKYFKLFEFRWNLVKLEKKPPTNNTNYALTATVSADSTFPGYSVLKIKDGDRNTALGQSHSWANNQYTPLPQYVYVDFGQSRSINRIDLYTTATYAISKYDLQYWNGSAWVQLATVTGNTASHRTHSFNAVNTTKIRVSALLGPSHQQGYVRINELEVY
ncbi:discoidin domain-containing protein [Paenibacillus assamensis]|uniref:discoidin domain-containing protein n=1 Tax=Paenibacillus assamensis TaxID=311244 RepID=UPI0004253FE0|nr:discoidin domain-containing protein [Paenibacillus assamensis]